jgi:hypothetical protein
MTRGDLSPRNSRKSGEPDANFERQRLNNRVFDVNQSIFEVIEVEGYEFFIVLGFATAEKR